MATVNLSEACSYEEHQDNVLGQGSFGCVYRGYNSIDQKLIAVKKVLKNKVNSHELLMLAKLKSPFVVALLSVHEMANAEFTFLVFELCDASLEKHITKRGNAPLPIPTVALVMDNIARGYLALYRINVVHLDIKPDNILLKYDQSGAIQIAKLADFSSSRFANPDVPFQQLAGTPDYMAPQVGANILDKSQYDYLVDMWSIGVVLYRCLTGKVPFEEQDLCKLFLYAAAENFGAYTPPELPQEVPEIYRLLLISLLQINPKDRLHPEKLFEIVTDDELLKNLPEECLFDVEPDSGVPESEVRGSSEVGWLRLACSHGCDKSHSWKCWVKTGAHLMSYYSCSVRCRARYRGGGDID